MNKALIDVSDLFELELHMMSAALYFADFSAVYPLVGKDSVVSKAIQNNDVTSAAKLLDRYFDMEDMTDSEFDELEKLYAETENAYAAKLKEQLLPLPKEFFVALGDTALQQNKFSTASTVFVYLNNLDKRIHELVDTGVAHLKSKESEEAQIEEKTKQAALSFYKAMRLLQPISLDFENIGVDFVLNEKKPLRRKFDKYIDQSVLKELLLVGIEYLIHEKSVSTPVINALEAQQVPAKNMRLLLKELSILFSGGEENYERFVRQYTAAVEHHQKNSDNEIKQIKSQEILLGRTVGDGNYFQYLKEIATQFPISALMITCLDTSVDIKYIAPRYAKTTPILELLGLDK